MRNLLLLIGTAFCSVSAMAAPKPAAPVAEPDLILRNGAIYLVEPAGRWAQALAVRDGRIVAIGSDAEIDPLRGSATRVVDLAGRMAMPGIIDNHVHVGAASIELMFYTCNFSAYSTFDEVIAAVAKCAQGKGPDDWIVGQNWSSALYDRLSQEDAIKRLDEASGGRPVMLRNDTIHDRWVNSRALQIAGITSETADPDNGKIGRDPKTGALNGLLIETAGPLVESKIPQPARSVESAADALAFGVAFLNSVGVTGFDDAVVVDQDASAPALGANPSNVPAYQLLEKQGRLTAHAALSMLIAPENPELDKVYARREQVRSANISMDFAKIFIDGVMVSRTGVFLEPYLPDREHGADFRGEPKMTQETLNKIVVDLDRRNISAKLHVSADGAVRMALDAIAAARKANGDKGPIHTLAHAGYIAPADIGRAATLRAAIDASPTVWYPGPILAGTETVIGKERANRFWPFKTMNDKGVIVAGGTDWKSLPGEFSDLWAGMEGMVTRRNPIGAAPGALWPEQAVDVETMIQFYTLNSAKVTRVADRAGSLKVGKLADIIVLDQNLFKVSPERISDTKVDLTFFGGKLAFDRLAKKNAAR